MMTRKGTALIAFALALVVSQPLMAQRRNQQQQQGQGRNYAPAPANQDELNAFQAINSETNPANRITLADQFLQKYPNSQLRGFIQRFRMDAFAKSNKPKEAIAAGEDGLAFEINYLQNLINKADAESGGSKDKKNDKKDKNDQPIDKNSPEFKNFVDETQKAMMFYYQSIMSSYQQLNDAPKTIEWGEKALGQDPEDLLTLLTLSSVLAERPPSDEKQMQDQMRRAEEYGKKALEKVTALVSSPASASMDAQQKASLQSTAHQTLGLVYLNTKKFPDSEKEYQAAIAAKKDDPVAHFRLGLAYVQDKKVDEAMDSLAKSVFLGGITQSQATDILKQLYEQKNKTLDGFEAYVKQAGAKVSQ